MRRLARLVLAFLVLLVATAGLLVWRLEQGPLSLAPVQPLLQRFVDRGSPFRVSFADPTLVWSRTEATLALRLKDLEVRTQAGAFVAGAPSAAVSVAAAPFLLKGRLEPVAVRLELPELELTREADGSLVLAFAGQLTALPLARAAGGGGLDALLGDAAPKGGDAGLAHLRHVRVAAPSLQFLDAATGRRATATDPLFQLRRHHDGWAVSLAARVGEGGIELAGEPGGRAEELRVTVDLVRFPVQALAGIVPALPPPGALDLPVSGRIAFPFDVTSRTPGVADLRLETSRATLALPEIGFGPASVMGASLAATLSPGWREATLGRLLLDGAGYGLAATGSIDISGAEPRGRLAIDARDLELPEILGLWPAKLAATARDWAKRNLQAGRITQASLEFDAPGAHPDQKGLGGSFAFTGVALRYLPELPPATDLAGAGRFAGDSLELAITTGRSAEVELARGRAVLANLMGAGHVRLAAELDLTSTVPAAFHLLDHPPVALGKATGLKADGLSGRQETRLELGLPLHAGVGPAEIRYRAETRLSDLVVQEVHPGYGLAADRLDVTAEPAAVTAKGRLRVNGVPLDLAWRENLAAAKGPKREVAATGRIDRAAADALGLAWPARLGGAVVVNANLVEAEHRQRTAELSLDLRDAEIRLPEALLAKQPGEPGRATARLVQPDAGRLAVERFRIDTAGLTAEGAAGLRLEPFALDRLALLALRMPMGDLTADLALERGVWRGRVDVGQLDLRPLLQARGGEGQGKGLAVPDLSLALTARSLRLGDAPFTGLAGTVERTSGIWRSVALRAGIEDSEVGLDLASREGTSALTLRSSDAGWLIRGFAATDNGVRGGQLRLTADLRQDMSPLRGQGELKIRNFTLWGAPLIARIVSLASFSGLGNALAGKGVPVDRLVVPFELDGSRVLLQEARLVGSDIGARADGTVDLAADRIELHGTIAPAYTINRLLGSIPILGQILSGSGSDAAIAATFSVEGPLRAPDVTVNPLAALVPGMVRDLFNALTADRQEPLEAVPPARP
jgi:hypothetical protein